MPAYGPAPVPEIIANIDDATIPIERDSDLTDDERAAKDRRGLAIRQATAAQFYAAEAVEWASFYEMLADGRRDFRLTFGMEQGQTFATADVPHAAAAQEEEEFSSAGRPASRGSGRRRPSPAPAPAPAAAGPAAAARAQAPGAAGPPAAPAQAPGTAVSAAAAAAAAAGVVCSSLPDSASGLPVQCLKVLWQAAGCTSTADAFGDPSKVLPQGLAVLLSSWARANTPYSTCTEPAAACNPRIICRLSER